MAATGVAKDQLKSFVERIERLNEEKSTLTADIAEVYAEAKSAGFDVPTLREVVKKRKMDTTQREEKEALLDLYLSALGMLADLPLGRAALHREGLAA